MKYVTLPDDKAHPLSYYLEMEEYVARHVDERDCLFMWQVGPSVIYGRNQVLENEVDLAYCREHGIQVYQRKSGGGCVYADMDNLMLSYVTTEEQVGIAFNRFVMMILLVLRKMGIEATGTSRNDIMIGQSKLCGTACRKIGNRCIIHSTLLYDTNMEHMLRAITPSREKMERHGIESVRQRITLLKDYTTLTLEEVKTLIRETLCKGTYRLTIINKQDVNQTRT